MIIVKQGNYLIIFLSLLTCLSCSNNVIQKSNTINPLPPLNLSDSFNQKLEFKVNSTVSGNEFFPVTAMDKKGNFIVAWKSNDAVYAQRFDNKSNRLGSEFVVSGDTQIDTNCRPAIAMNRETGGFIIAWNAYETDKSNYRVYTRKYDNTGKGDELPLKINENIIDLSKTKTGNVPGDTITRVAQNKFFHTVVDVAMNNKNEFVVTWSSYKQDGSSNDIYARLYDSKAKPGTGEIRLDNPPKSNQYDPRVAIGPQSNFIITWGLYRRSDEKDGTPVISNGIFARRFDNKGIAQGDEIKVSNQKEGVKEEPTVCLAEDGRFIIAWAVYKKSKRTNLINDSFSLGIYFQKFNPDGSTDNKTIKVSPAEDYIQSYPEISFEENNNFLISWLKDELVKNLKKSIHFQRFNKNNVPSGKELTVSGLEFKYQHRLATGSKGNIVVVWDGSEKSESGSDIYAKIFEN